ncbi:thermopsin family protease [Caldisphaera sp.]|uniref:thermopsin family protease n=1 Tax=Caldisphaera sp. TaxID=2060322 RepID=UPI003D0A3720
MYNKGKIIFFIGLCLIVLISLPIIAPIIAKNNKHKNQITSIVLDAKIINQQYKFNGSVGINDNGSVLIGNSIIDYAYSTKALLGYFAFYGGKFYSGSPANLAGFSLQLNSNFNVTKNMILWAQNVFIIKYKNNNYYINVEDNLWNSTTTLSSLNQSLVSGNGGFSESNNRVLYYNYALTNFNIINYITKAPFYLYAKMVINQTNSDYPQVYMYYNFRNSTYNSGWVLYDIITIHVKSSNPQFLTGIQSSINSYYQYKPFITQWIVGGLSSGSQLIVYKWNALMNLYYMYNNSFYSVPDALSLQPSIFTGGITEENVNQNRGIKEYYKNGIVYQFQGINKQKFLWEPHLYYAFHGNNLTIYLTPSQGEWKITVIGNNYYNETFGRHAPISFILKPGEYRLIATLYAGSKPIRTFTYTLLPSGYMNFGKIINSCTNITSPGYYELITNLYGTQNTTYYCLGIFTKNVTINGNLLLMKNNEFDIGFNAGIYVNATNVTISNINITGYSYGVDISSKYDYVEGNIIYNNGYGIVISGNDIVNNNIIYNNRKGIGVSGDNNIIYNNLIYNNGYGISISSNKTSIYNNLIYNNEMVGLYSYNSYDGLVYNNLFNNTINAEVYFTIFKWNSSLRYGINILGGNIIGGNAWLNPNDTGFSQTCLSSNVKADICDNVYSIWVNNTDFLPLKYPQESEYKTYNITFEEIGLPKDTTWYVTLDNVTNFSNSSRIVLKVSKGSHLYIINQVNDYFSVPSTGIIVVTGNTTRIITFIPLAHAKLSLSTLLQSIKIINYLPFITIGLVIIVLVVALVKKKKI